MYLKSKYVVTIIFRQFFFSFYVTGFDYFQHLKKNIQQENIWGGGLNNKAKVFNKKIQNQNLSCEKT